MNQKMTKIVMNLLEFLMCLVLNVLRITAWNSTASTLPTKDYKISSIVLYFLSEQTEYLTEGVEWKEIEIPDNGACIGLLKYGFTELDSACKFGKDPKKFIDNFLGNPKVVESDFIHRPKRQPLSKLNRTLSTIAEAPRTPGTRRSRNRGTRSRSSRSEDWSAKSKLLHDEQQLCF
eukprot:TRINITY_DN4723_c0_g1_i1.p1 TRINITY_DN4723_c0_g1~~TRINITY_DN4723_c0_g1_i1.p1  ORF type:complete len:176 (-),score=21.35 TRINITY_DN4723_c0_g1_i1:75-602(-)